MMGHFLFLKAHKLQFYQHKAKEFFITCSSEESAGFFTILYIYPDKWRNVQPKATGRKEKKKTHKLQLLSTFLKIHWLI